MSKKYSKEVIDAWILIRSHIDLYRKVSSTIPIFNAVNVLDEEFNTIKNNTYRKIEHVCGLQDFQRELDTCNACMQNK